LLRAADLRALQRTIVSVLPRGIDARSAAVIVPTRSAARQLRRTIEDSILETARDSTVVLPDFVTRAELYVRLHQRLSDAPPLLTEFERDVLLRLAADDAQQAGTPAPFRLRPGLLLAISAFYDELRRRNRSIDSLDRHVRAPLEAVSDTDRGAERLLVQTRFLSAAYAAFERRLADSGRIDEHGLRALLLAGGLDQPYRYVVVTVADQAADPNGLWPADFDLLSRLPGVARLDVVATERMLESGWHQRVHEALPGLDEERVGGASSVPMLLTPPSAPPAEPRDGFAARDREEELVDAARWIKRRARAASADPGAVLDRTAIVFQRPLPYLYLARNVFESANIPYQAVDALPLAAEPVAAAIDLLFTIAAEEATRSSVIEVLASPHWRIHDPARPDTKPERGEIAALDRALKESKYLGGWDRLAQLAATIGSRTAAPGREGARWRRAAPALAAASALGPALQPFTSGAAASTQLAGLLDVIATLEALPQPADPGFERHMRARGAILGAIAMLRDAHAAFDDRPVPIAELVATLRRWIEGQTFMPASGHDGVRLLDAPAAAFADLDAVRLVGLVESDWPERSAVSIFYPSSLLRDLGWAAETDRLAAARAQFRDLLQLPAGQISVSSFTLEDDALVSPSPFLEDVPGGLPVERATLEGQGRIFTHEALARPVAAAAIAGAAAAWLGLRRSRTSPADVRYHGSTAARGPEVYAVSRIERYLECPFKYFAAQVLQLEEEREDESGLTVLERGQLLHGVFEAFFRRWRAEGRGTMTADALAEATAMFREVAEAQLSALPEGDRALERTYLLGSAAAPGLAERAFAFEVEHGVGVVERLIEYQIEGTFVFDGPGGPRRIAVRGKADRIDVLADETLRVVDYKLGRAPKTGRALQLPIYGVSAAQQLARRTGRTRTVSRAGYVAFKEKNAFVDIGGRGGQTEAALKEGEARFVEAIDGIESGRFPVDPDEPWLCTRCGFAHVCRKDYVGDE
jgi:RecB family exonuclease